MAREYVRRMGSSADGTQWFCNVLYVDGKCVGGDAHWLSVAAADLALANHLKLDWYRAWVGALAANGIVGKFASC